MTTTLSQPKPESLDDRQRRLNKESMQRTRQKKKQDMITLNEKIVAIGKKQTQLQRQKEELEKALAFVQQVKVDMISELCME